MGKIFGISKLPVSTMDQALKPTQELVKKAPSKRVVTGMEGSIQKAPVRDVFVKKPKNPSTMAK